MAEIVERRRRVRHSIDLGARISFGDGRAPVAGRLTNFNEDGLFVAVSNPADVGASISVELLTNQGSVLGRVAGRVAWRMVAPPGAPMPSGVGVEITRVEKDWIAFCASRSD